MKTVIIKLDSITKVREFVDITNRFEENIEVSSKRFTANAKSLMDLYTLDLNSELKLAVKSEENFPKIIRELEPYIVAKDF